MSRVQLVGRRRPVSSVEIASVRETLLAEQVPVTMVPP